MQIREKSVAAVALGRMGKGKPKTLTEAQRQALADRMRAIQIRIRLLKTAKAFEAAHEPDLPQKHLPPFAI